MRNISLITFIIILTGTIYSQSNSAPATAPKIQVKSAYNVPDKIHVDGNEGWDLLAIDETTERLFLSHGSMVQVVDLNTKKVVGTIPETKGVHGIALAPDLNKGFTTNGKDTSVTIFNLKTLNVISKIKVTGINPDAILYDQFSGNVFVYNGKSSNATVLEANSNKIIGTLELPGKPELSVCDEKGSVFVNIEDKSLVCRINSKSLKIEQTWPIAPGQEASGIAMDVKNQRLFIVCDNKMMVIMNSENGKTISTLPIGEGVDGVAFDPFNRRVYSSNGEGTVTVVQEMDENTFTVLETLPTQKGARTIAVNTSNHHIYLPAADFEPEISAGGKPHSRPKIKPNTFVVLDIGLTN